MKSRHDRTKMLIGSQAVERLWKKAVIVFGAGGVGGFVLEALARSGVGTIGVVDFDTVDVTNLNRQILALQSTVGRRKTEAAAERIAAIDPNIKVNAFPLRLTADNAGEFHLEQYDYIVDAIDDVAAKLLLIKKADELGVPILCCMGTGNKLDPERLRIAPLEKTHTCPLARRIRKGTRELSGKNVWVVFSDEEPRTREPSEDGSRPPASAVFVPAAAGLMMASKVVRELAELDDSSIFADR